MTNENLRGGRVWTIDIDYKPADFLKLMISMFEM